VTSDEQLVAEYLGTGSRGALEELADRHLGTVRRMIHSMTLEDSLADDLVQEVFLRAFRGLASFQGRSKFTTWLYRVTMNTVHETLDRQRRSPIDRFAPLPDVAVPNAPSPERNAMGGELGAAVACALARLPEKLRAAIVLVTLEQLDPAEAARIEGCTRATIYWRLHEARKRLAEWLQEHLP
jgi:RNA polymerase sigma-70 factor (ECF subfamily)